MRLAGRESHKSHTHPHAAGIFGGTTGCFGGKLSHVQPPTLFGSTHLPTFERSPFDAFNKMQNLTHVFINLFTPFLPSTIEIAALLFYECVSHFN